jgi:hypothetical protein
LNWDSILFISPKQLKLDYSLTAIAHLEWSWVCFHSKFSNRISSAFSTVNIFSSTPHQDCIIGLPHVSAIKFDFNIGARPSSKMEPFNLPFLNMALKVVLPISRLYLSKRSKEWEKY